jgi:enamine deaminase RidA (YjgF/YER057c/UK114 family)
MNKETVSTDKAPKAIGPYEQAIRVGDFVYASGQIPLDPKTGNLIEGDIKIQTRRVMENQP